VYGHAAAAAVLLTGYAALVIKQKPFAFAFQNQLELFLLFCDVLVLSLGVVYTFLMQVSHHWPPKPATPSPVLSPHRPASQPVRKDAVDASGPYRKIVEACMLAILSTSVIVAFLVLIRSIQLSRSSIPVSDAVHVGWEGRKLRRERAESVEEHYSRSTACGSKGAEDSPSGTSGPRRQRQLSNEGVPKDASSPARSRVGVRRSALEASPQRNVVSLDDGPSSLAEDSEVSWAGSTGPRAAGPSYLRRLSGIGSALVASFSATSQHQASERERAQSAWSQACSTQQEDSGSSPERGTGMCVGVSAWLSGHSSAMPQRFAQGVGARLSAASSSKRRSVRRSNVAAASSGDRLSKTDSDRQEDSLDAPPSCARARHPAQLLRKGSAGKQGSLKKILRWGSSKMGSSKDGGSSLGSSKGSWSIKAPSLTPRKVPQGACPQCRCRFVRGPSAERDAMMAALSGTSARSTMRCAGSTGEQRTGDDRGTSLAPSTGDLSGGPSLKSDSGGSLGWISGSPSRPGSRAASRGESTASMRDHDDTTSASSRYQVTARL
jgi:hypothetical protein